MNSNNLDSIKTKLLELKEAILARQKTEDIDIAGDEVDAIQGKMLANVQSQLSSRDVQKLKQIDAAFSKIEEGSFGNCEECGEEIPVKRLLINPIFENCVFCAEKMEAEAKKFRSP